MLTSVGCQAAERVSINYDRFCHLYNAQKFPCYQYFEKSRHKIIRKNVFAGLIQNKQWSILANEIVLVFHAEVKVGLIENVNSDVAVFTARGITASVWVEHDAVDGAEVALDTREFLVFENLERKASSSLLGELIGARTIAMGLCILVIRIELQHCCWCRIESRLQRTNSNRESQQKYYNDHM